MLQQLPIVKLTFGRTSLSLIQGGAFFKHLSAWKFKGTYTACFSISFYNVNQMPISPRINLHCETIRAECSSG